MSAQTKLALTPQFLSQSYQMPMHVQKALSKFYKEFPKDTQAATWHVEPISTFRDPHLRTARANQQYRIILRIPFDGDDTWYLLWIDNHDEAMDWAKNKQVDWNEEVQAVQVYDISEAEAVAAANTDKPTESVAPQPLEQITDEQLIQIGVPKVLIPSIRTLKDFFAVDQIRDYIPEGVYENLLHLFAGDPIEYIIRDVEEGLVASPDFQAQKMSANNRRGILELSGDEALDKALLGDFAAWRVFLHPTQRILAEGNFKGPIKVTGGAGTGKTVAALHRAKYLSKKGQGRILFTTFTKSLTETLEKDLRDLGANMSQIRITNLDKLVVQLVRQYRLVKGRLGILEFTNKQEMAEGMLENLLFEAGLFEQYSGRDMLIEYRDIILAYNCQSLSDYQNVLRSGRGFRLGSNQRKVIWELLQKYEKQLTRMGYRHLGRLYNDVSNYLTQNPDQKPFRHIVADEIQDLGLVKLRFLRALAPEAEDDLFLVGDPLQKIYPGTTTFSKVRIHIRGKRSRKLKINYRTTEQIRQFALLPVLPLDLEDFDGEAADKRAYISLRSGEEPAYQLYESPEDEVENLLQDIHHYIDADSTEKIAASEIAVACPKNRQLDQLVKQFHQAKIPYYKFSGSKSKGDRNGVVLSTMNNLKGHEYKVVFLLHIDGENYPTRPTGYQSWTEDELSAHDRHQAALLYVASSRAITRLHVSGVGEACPFISSLVDQ